MNNDSLEKLRSDLRSDLKKYSLELCKSCAKKIADELTDETRSAIQEFYTYDPKYYYRHGNFNHSFRRYYKNHGGRFSGGVELLEDLLPNVYQGKNTSSESVFWRVYLGFHGIASLQGYAPIMTPSPIQRIYKKRDEIIQNQKTYVNYAERQAEKASYIILFK